VTPFALQPAAEQRVLIEQIAARRGILPLIVEKDFWVCWVLGRVFATPGVAESLVFKGGTSLSKVFGVIDRFSEDADLSVSPAVLGFTETDLDEAPSATQRSKRMQRLAAACEDHVREVIQPRLEDSIQDVLGLPKGGAPWLRFEIDPVAGTPNIWFRYPSVLPQAGGYIAKQVKLELGALTDQQPTGRHTIQPLLADALGLIFDDFQCPVVALEMERTFWEKATILHAEFHRPAGQPIKDRSARHYSDMAALWRHPGRNRALERMDLLADVVRHKSRFFASSWASYDTAIAGSFHLLPPQVREAELARDLHAMSPMFLGASPTLASILQALAEAEAALNS